MAKTATKKKPSTQKAGRKMTGLDDNPINLNSPPPSNKQRSKALTCFSVNTLRGFTVNPYAQGTKNKIDIILHKGGVPPKDVQPQVTLLPGGRMLGVLWKTLRSCSRRCRPLSRGSSLTPPAVLGTVTQCNSW